MSSYWIYSHEALPNPKLMGKPGYNPDGCYIRTGGVTLPAIPEKEWLELDQEDSRYKTYYRWNWTQNRKQLDEHFVPLKRFISVVKNRFSERGVVMLDHKPTAQEKEVLAEQCEAENLRFRKRAVEFFEQQREIAIANKGTYAPTPYIDECYDVLTMKKPYSVEALKAQRDPGAEAAQRMADAMEGALGKFSDAIQDAMTRPERPAARP